MFHQVDHEEDKKSYVRCVRCSEMTEIPGDDVSMLPYNFFASNAMDYLLIQCTKDNVLICNACQDKNCAISRCVECSEFLCVTCVTAHRRIKVKGLWNINVPVNVIFTHFESENQTMDFLSIGKQKIYSNIVIRMY